MSNFLEEISSLSPSIVFLYFFALITEEGFLTSPCYSLELCIQISSAGAAAVWYWNSYEEILHVQGQRSPSKMVGGVKLHLESNSIPARDSRRPQTKPVHTKKQISCLRKPYEYLRKEETLKAKEKRKAIPI